jgi:hypothetical protein
MPSSTSACLNGRAAGWLVRLEQSSVPSGWSGDTTVSQRVLAERDLVLLHEAEHVGVEAQRLGLVVDQDAHHVDPHSSASGSGPSPAIDDLRSGAVSRWWNL